jgi:hypothetical protein
VKVAKYDDIIAGDGMVVTASGSHDNNSED